MKRFSILLVAVALFAVAAAQQSLTIAVNDDAFSYYDLKKGNLLLSYEDGVLTFHLHETAVPNSIPHSFDKISEISDVLLDTIYATPKPGRFHSQRELVRQEKDRLMALANIGEHQGGWQITHKSLKMEDAVEIYLDRLAEFGFEATPGLQTVNIRVYTISNGSYQARLVFNRQGTGVNVFFN